MDQLLEAAKQQAQQQAKNEQKKEPKPKAQPKKEVKEVFIPKKIDKKKPEDEKERYHETEQTLDRLADELDKVDKLKSRAYGKGHLDAIKQEISLLKQEVDVQADYLR